MGQGGGQRTAVVIDDEVAVTEVVAAYLRRDGFVVDVANDGIAGLSRVRTAPPDVVVLDLGLPGMDGIEVCRNIRTFSDCYVIMLTARVDEVDTLLGLGVGADDYLTKPFSPRELAARIQVMMRRPRSDAQAAGAAELIRIGGLAIDLAAREITLDGVPVELTRIEFDLLAALAAEPSRVLSRLQIIQAVWGPAWVGDEHLVDVHILHLRKKLGDTADRQAYVRTVRGIGYRMGACA